MSGHRRDMWGIFFVALGLIAGLGVYIDGAGPIGNGLARFFGAVVGLSRVLLPIAFIAVGIILIRGHLRRPKLDLTEGDAANAEAEALRARHNEEQGIRLMIGGLVTLIAIAGLTQLWAGDMAGATPLMTLSMPVDSSDGSLAPRCRLPLVRSVPQSCCLACWPSAS